MGHNSFIKTPQVSELINELRGGSWSTLLVNKFFVAILYSIGILGKSECFLQQPNPSWELPLQGLYDPSGLVRLTDWRTQTQLHARSSTQSLKT